MSKYTYTEAEQQLNRILTYQRQQLQKINFDRTDTEKAINETEILLRSLGYGADIDLAKADACNSSVIAQAKSLVLPDWNELCRAANLETSENCTLEDLFTKGELLANEQVITKLNQDYNSLHRLDKIDWTICAVAGVISAALDILLVGIPGPSVNGPQGGPLSNYIRELFEKKFPPEEMEKLGGQKCVKTPYDAQDNRHTDIHVEGLSAYYHRLLSLGHDPLLGWIVGTLDIMTGRMTTIDKTGKIVVQKIQQYAGREEHNVFRALCKQMMHLKSDLTTSMGLPAPLMGLFNLCQFGSIGEEQNTIAEVVQGMYYEGYDFIQFCSSSIPVMTTEVIVRLAWSIKRIKNGCSIKEAIPVSLDRTKNPKLATMLFISHSAATAINAGKVFFAKNPMAINYPQWLAFAKYLFKQLKWNLYEKPTLREKYVTEKIDDEFKDILSAINQDFENFNATPLISFSDEKQILTI